MTGEATSASFRRDVRTTADGNDHRRMWLSQPASQGAQSGEQSPPDKGLGDASGRRWDLKGPGGSVALETRRWHKRAPG